MSDSVKIAVTGGRFAIVDAEFQYLAAGCWRGVVGRSGVVYAERRTRVKGSKNGCTHELLHRLVLGLKRGDPWVDHINGNGLDCRKENLRICSRYENAHNRAGANRDTSTGVLGVSPKGAKYQAYISVDGVRRILGSYPTIESARTARLQAEKMFWGISPRRESEFKKEGLL